MAICSNCGRVLSRYRQNRHKKGAVVIKPYGGVPVCTPCKRSMKAMAERR